MGEFDDRENDEMGGMCLKTYFDNISMGKKMVCDDEEERKKDRNEKKDKSKKPRKSIRK